MLGQVRSSHLTHAADAAVRTESASGGSASALLINELEQGRIDGAIVCVTEIEDGKVRAHFRLARTRVEILAARGSKYVETRFLKEVLPLLRDNEGRFAVCGLPCDITNLRRWEQKEPELSRRVALRLAFLCGHNSRAELIDGVTEKLAKHAPGQTLTEYKFRTGHWRGQLEAKFGDVAVQKPFSYFSDYRNCFFFAERKCLACIDHFGYDADISLGDVWLFSLKDDPVKHTGVLVRTPAGAAAFEAAVSSGAVVSKEVSRELILDGQARIAPTHFDVSARASAARVFGVKLPVERPRPVAPHKYLSALVAIANMRWSEGPHWRAVFAIPRPLLRTYLFVKKGLESIK